MRHKSSNPLGPVGTTVRENIKKLREVRKLSYAELSRQLTSIGRPIHALGLRRLEDGDRRVDVDDLCALAFVLGVEPSRLLNPLTVEAHTVFVVEEAL